jgi:hypothetical protein
MTRCTGCGLVIEGGREGCRAIFDEVIALHFSNASYFGVHRLFVDTYCMQHTEEYCVSFKSLAAHLAHLCWSLEYGGGRAVPNEMIRRWVERHPHLEKPALPDERGALTVADVARAVTPAEHQQAVDAWARTTWDAYAPLHSTARHWVDLALSATKYSELGDTSRTRGGRIRR